MPPGWQLLTEANFDDNAFRHDVGEMVLERLKGPVGSQPLDRKLTRTSRIAILIEDLTRKSPKKQILAALLSYLQNLGIKDKNVSIIIALGTHQPLTGKELAYGYGDDILSRYRFINHDCYAEDLVKIGQLQSGTSVKINPHVYAADFRIGIGSIFPHPMNGFGGGAKILFPGVADHQSTFEHHMQYSFVGQSRMGNLQGNEFHLEVNRLGCLGKLDFIINSVLDHNDIFYDLVCGAPVAAHEEGCRLSTDIIAKQFDSPADITIISAFPYTEGPQIMKPFAAAESITKKNGCIILCADCTVALPEKYFVACKQFRDAYSPDLRLAVLDHFATNRGIIDNTSPEMNMSLAQVLLALNDYTVILVTRDIGASDVQRLGFVHAKQIEEALSIAAERFTNPSVNIVPSGGVILPVMKKQTTYPAQ
ncbi:MAG: lactate racemase domain-containing protein [Desulforhopalus sp.]